MSGRVELMEAALEAHPEGVALLDAAGQVLFWNRAAETMTGFGGIEMVGRSTPWALEQLVHGGMAWDEVSQLHSPAASRASLVHAQHKLGGDLAVAARRFVLRDELGERIGMAVLFHPAEVVEGLPRGESGPSQEMDEAQAQLETRLTERFEELMQGGAGLALIWLMVDQAHDLRRTHGGRACEAMMDRMQRTLAGGLHPGEELGRWGEDEFLVLTANSQTEALQARAQALTGGARTVEFRWWGDRISLTISAGVAQAQPDEMLVSLLERAKAAMFSSLHAGGNHVTVAPGRQSCSRS
jgi:PAS domain S-box-containing protein